MLPQLDLDASEHGPNTCVFREDAIGARLYHVDCLSFMDALAAQCSNGLFDAIFADPPYFLSNGGITCHAGRMVRVDKGNWDKSRGPEINHEFNTAWIARCQRLLKANGTLWVTGTHHVIHSVGYAMQQLGMKLLNDITWEKPNPPPNLSCRYFTHAAETIIWAARDERSKHRFDYERMKALNGGRQMKSIWTIGAPGKAEKPFGRHPTQKPVALLNRIPAGKHAGRGHGVRSVRRQRNHGRVGHRTPSQVRGCELERVFVDLAVNRLEAASASRAASLDLEGVSR